ncbi:MAG: YkgJ family cysteine cluster protein, partial [archaeon]
MIKINCDNCPNHCCGMNPGLTPVLLPSEEERFLGKTRSVYTPHREMKLISKQENGNCIFLGEGNRCTVYNERPLECRLFPFLLDFEERVPKVELDMKNCPHIDTLESCSDSISAFLRQ